MLKYFSFLSFMFSLNCATMGVATREDYKPSVREFSKGNITEAREALPKKEDGGFIHTFEEAWLDFLAKEPQPEKLVRLTENLEDRKTFRYSKELKTLFYIEANDHYFPGEHEVIFAHVLNAYSYAAKGEVKEARIEIQRASRYIQGHFSDRAGDFDDPSLRIMIGSLWAFLGEWQEARFDFKVAAKLLPYNKDLQKLARATQAPKELAIILAGSGHQPEWNPKASAGIVTGLQKIDFVPTGEPENLQIILSNADLVKTSPEAISTTPWYDRHQERNQVIKDVLKNSQYAINASAGAVASTTVATGSIILGVGIMVVGIAGGIYAGTVGQLGNLAAGIIGLGVYSGLKVMDFGLRTSKDIVGNTMDPTERYRYVRFLPENLYFYPNDSYEEILEINDGEKNYPPVYSLKSPPSLKGSDISLFFINNKNSPLNYWIDKKQKRGWILGPVQSRAQLPSKNCGIFSENLRGKLCRYPKATELKEALSHNIIGRCPLSFSRAFVENTKVWLTPDNGQNCRYYHLTSGEIHVSEDCIEEGIISLYITEK